MHVILFADQDYPGFEALCAEDAEGNYYEILYSPGFDPIENKLDAKDHSSFGPQRTASIERWNYEPVRVS